MFPECPKGISTPATPPTSTLHPIHLQKLHLCQRRTVLDLPVPGTTDLTLQSSLSQALSLSGYGICPQPNCTPDQSVLPFILLSDTGLILLKYQFDHVALRMKNEKKKKEEEEEEIVECKKKCWHCSQGVGREKGMTSESIVIPVG